MAVPAIVFASENLMDKIKQDKTLQQARNVACLRGIIKNALTMPDAHQGYGFPIGGVAAFNMADGVVSPGGVGYDINCGVRLLRTDYSISDIENLKNELLNTIFENVPAGLGSSGKIRLSRNELNEVVEKGARWAVEKGYGRPEDLERTEEYGHMKSDFTTISERAMKRGIPQLGSLGSGNHFLEIQKVVDIYDPEIAKAFGIEEIDQITVMIHCGSRGLGHQVASDYIQRMEQIYGYAQLPDRELINAPIHSEIGEKYLKAMSGAANFAWANRQLITHWVRESFEKVLGSSESLDMVYDVAHNIAKTEEHKINGSTEKVCIHRKGATRSLGPGRKELPEVYKTTGQPVIIPGSMGTYSYLLVGTEKAEEASFGSTAHGAGRVLSRHAALRKFRGEGIVDSLAREGITVKGASMKGIAEESPGSYKDINEVVRVSHEAGIGNLVARFRPLGVIKG